MHPLADLIRAAGTLELDRDGLRAAAAMLGLVLADPPPVPEPLTPLPVPPAPGPSATAASPDVDVHTAEGDPRPARRVRVTLVEGPVAAPPRPLRGSVHNLLPPAPAPRPAEPLFSPWHERAILSTLAKVRCPGPEVDTPAVTRMLARREAVVAMPVLAEPTTRLGARLWVDYGPGMRLFRRDLRWLAAALRRVVGQDAVTVEPFRDTLPERAAGAVLVATDLGIGAGSPIPPAAWPPDAVFLVPYPRSRWPAWAARLPVVQWDRRTTAGQAARR